MEDSELPLPPGYRVEGGRPVAGPALPAPRRQRRRWPAGVLVPVLLLGLVAGSLYLAHVTAAPTPTERAVELATRLAPGILAAFRADNDPASIAQLVATRRAWEAETGCAVLGGAVLPETTRAAAVAHAERLIAGEPVPDEGVGVGYVVVPASGAVPGFRFVAVVIAVRCAVPASPALPGGP